MHLFCLDLPHSGACFVKAYPAERIEAFLDGHNAAFALLGGVPRSILYDNTKLGGGPHPPVTARASRRGPSPSCSRTTCSSTASAGPGKGNDKGKVEGLVGYARRNFLVPIPTATIFAELNARLEQHCLNRLPDRLRGHAESIGEQLERDLAALLPRPPVPYDACDRRPARVSSLALVRYERNDYSVWPSPG